jgi:hypothetical protein
MNPRPFANLNLSSSWTINTNHLALNSNDLSAYQTPGVITNISIISGNGLVARPVFAADCVLFFCARSYEASSSLNVFHENSTGLVEKPAWKLHESVIDKYHFVPIR